MAVDFNAVTNFPLLQIYGRQTAYRPLVSRPNTPAFALRGIWDRHHQIVLNDIPQSEIDAPGHSTTVPVLTVALAHFVAPPRQGDEIVIDAETFRVWDSQPDGEGMTDLILRKKS